MNDTNGDGQARTYWGRILGNGIICFMAAAVILWWARLAHRSKGNGEGRK